MAIHLPATNQRLQPLFLDRNELIFPNSFKKGNGLLLSTNIKIVILEVHLNFTGSSMVNYSF